MQHSISAVGGLTARREGGEGLVNMVQAEVRLPLAKMHHLIALKENHATRAAVRLQRLVSGSSMLCQVLINPVQQ